MVEIDELNPASILYNLMTRYRRDEIYTYVGPILLVLNPFKAIEGINDEENRLRYVEIVNSATPY
jgi:myosin heavy subunit